MGKRAGKPSLTQDEINRLIVENAYKYGHVVRLKGGDPFIFGRGYEEIEHAVLFGLDTAVVSGISSATSLTGVLNIPLTHRNVSRGFTVVTATNSKGELTSELSSALAGELTVVVLMGLKKLDKITEALVELGKSDLPLLIVQNGSTDRQNVVSTSAKNAVADFKNNQVEGPGIIVVGEVVGLRDQSERKLLERYLYN